MSATPDTARPDRPESPARPARATRPVRRRPDRLGRRLVQLYAGLVLYGVSMAFFVEGALGVMPWDVLHQGLVRLVPVSLGTMTILAGAVVLLLWIPLRQLPGLGTVSNVVVIGLVVDLALRVLPTPGPLVLRAVFVAVGVGLNAVATAAYIGARFGPGPRDGLMTGLVARTGWPVRVVRTAIEVSVVGLGWLLGGNFGPGTRSTPSPSGRSCSPCCRCCACRNGPTRPRRPPADRAGCEVPETSTTHVPGPRSR